MSTAIRFNLLQVFPSVHSFVFSELVFLCFTQFGGSSRRLNYDKFRDTTPLKKEMTRKEGFRN